jgi:hypothetical protein
MLRRLSCRLVNFVGDIVKAFRRGMSIKTKAILTRRSQVWERKKEGSLYAHRRLHYCHV